MHRKRETLVDQVLYTSLLHNGITEIREYCGWKAVLKNAVDLCKLPGRPRSSMTTVVPKVLIEAALSGTTM